MNNRNNYQLLVVIIIAIAFLILIGINIVGDKTVDEKESETTEENELQIIDNSEDSEDSAESEEIDILKQTNKVEIGQPFSVNILNLNRNEIELEIVNSGNKNYILERVHIESCGTVNTAIELAVGESESYNIPCNLNNSFYKTVVLRYSEGIKNDTLSVVGYLEGNI